MNAIQMLASQPWVQRLGTTLLHFLWQGSAIALLYGAARHYWARNSNPRVRYLLACGALAAVSAAPVLTWLLLRPPDAGPPILYRIQSTPAPASSEVVATTAALPESIRAAVSAVQPEQFLSWVVILWLAGAVVFWIRMFAGWILAARMRSVSVRRAPPEWQQTLGRLAEQVGVDGPVRLLVSALVQTPAVVGWLRPVVLVPVGALAGLPAAQVEALLLHELAHMRRHDYLVNILQSMAESLLFYHPAVWWISGHIRAEREHCCDDVAVSIAGDAFTYACALAQLEAYRPAHPAAAMAANGGSLAGRIARLLGRPRPSVRGGLGPGALAAALLLLAAAYGLFAQSGARPAFQVASVKRGPVYADDPTHHPMGGGYQPGGRLHMVNMPLIDLIQFAYADHDSPHWLPLPRYLVVGGPAWADTDGYDIDAKPESPVDPKQMWLMTQTLLADRFKLVLHRETRQLPVYVLQVAKGGPKLPPAKPAECLSFPPGTPPHHVPGKVDCGYVSGPGGESPAGPLHIWGRKAHVSDLARELTFTLGRPVLDQTGFSGEFDVNLTYYPDQSSQGPTLFEALQEQLGLKLTATKGPVEVLVIDHAQRPTPN